MSSIQSTAAVPTVNRSALFVQFNKARAASTGLDRKRVNRALGLVLSGKVALLDNGAALVAGSSEPAYWVSADGCDCADHTFRGKTCKHMVARWFLLKMERSPQPVSGPNPDGTPLPPLPPAPPLDTTDVIDDLIGELWGAA